MILIFSSWSLRRLRISDTRLACKVGVNLRGSSMLTFSSVLTSREDLFEPFLSLGRGGGEELLGGVFDRRDFLELRDGVRYGVSAGVGSDTTAGVLSSSSVSQAAMVTVKGLVGDRWSCPGFTL